MTDLDIVKSEDGRETIFRFANQGQGTLPPTVRIKILNKASHLGPKGWQPEAYDIGVIEARHDLVVSVESRLTNYIEAGKAVEIEVPALGLVEKLSWPDQIQRLGGLYSEESPKPSDDGHAEELKAMAARAAAAGDRASALESELAVAKDAMAALEKDVAAAKRAASGQAAAATDLTALRQELDKALNDLEAAKAKIKELESRDDKTESVSSPTPSPKTLAGGGSSKTKRIALVAAAALLGIGLGAGGLRLVDPGDVYALKREIGRLRTEAFAPLAMDLGELPQRSPQGKSVSADDLPPTTSRARAYYNYGVSKAQSPSPESKREAVFWYKQAARLCEKEALSFIGDAYFWGSGETADQRTGFQLMRCASALGSLSASAQLTQVLMSGRLDHLPPDEARDLASRFRQR